MENEIKTGDIILLKSGSARLTAAGIVDGQLRAIGMLLDVNGSWYPVEVIAHTECFEIWQAY